MKKILLRKCHLVLAVIAALLLTATCTVEKRRYTKGFYVDRTGKSQNDATVRHSKTRKARTPVNGFPDTNQPASVADEATILVASAGKADAPPRFVPKRHQTPPDTCDVIVMRDGSEIRAKVLEISEKEVKYRKCSMPDGPAFVSLKSDIFMITYIGGRKEVFEQEKQAVAQQPATARRVEHPDAVTVYILTATGWLLGIGSIPAIVIGNKVLREIRAQPLRYKGEDGVKLAVIISWVRVAIILAALLIIIAVLAAI